MCVILPCLRLGIEEPTWEEFYGENVEEFKPFDEFFIKPGGVDDMDDTFSLPGGINVSNDSVGTLLLTVIEIVDPFPV